MMRSSAGILLLDKDKKFLLQHRDVKTKDGKKLKRFPGYWAFFGGKIEKRESPKKAAKRELEEELGIKSDSLKFVGKYSSRQRKEKQYIFTTKLTYSIKDLKRKQENTKEREGQGLKKFSFRKADMSKKVPRFEKTILKDLAIKNIIS